MLGRLRHEGFVEVLVVLVALDDGIAQGLDHVLHLVPSPSRHLEDVVLMDAAVPRKVLNLGPLDLPVLLGEVALGDAEGVGHLAVVYVGLSLTVPL